jgi:hypothetical protein
MEFDFNTWSRNPSSHWLVKFTDDDIYTGCVTLVSSAVVEVFNEGLRRRFSIDDVEWIRPLLTVTADGWTVVAGFQPEDFTFDTWWQRDELLLLINFSDRSGFSPMHQIISQHLHPVETQVPSDGTREAAYIQLHGLLMTRRDLPVSAAARMQ